MTPPKGFITADEMRKRRPISPESRERIDHIKQGLELEMNLQELRELAEHTQAQVAAYLETSRPNVARIERETDVRLSTLRKYVAALGGELVISVRFKDREVSLTEPEETEREKREPKRPAPKSKPKARVTAVRKTAATGRMVKQ